MALLCKLCYWKLTLPRHICYNIICLDYNSCSLSLIYKVICWWVFDNSCSYFQQSVMDRENKVKSFQQKLHNNGFNNLSFKCHKCKHWALINLAVIYVLVLQKPGQETAKGQRTGSVFETPCLLSLSDQNSLIGIGELVYQPGLTAQSWLNWYSCQVLCSINSCLFVFYVNVSARFARIT